MLPEPEPAAASPSNAVAVPNVRKRKFGIFLFPDDAVPHLQKQFQAELIGVWTAFLQHLQEAHPEHTSAASGSFAAPPLWPSLRAGSLAALTATVTLLQDASTTAWFPDYGCALLALPRPGAEDDLRPLQDQTQLLLVGLDNWTFHLHGTSVGSGTDHTSVCENYTAQWGSTIPASQFKDLVGIVHRLVAKRHPKANKDKCKKGFNHTPAFIYAVVEDAVQKLADMETDDESITFPRGGYTDVGQHTGSQPRNTAWPLVAQVIKALLHHTGVCDPNIGCSPPATLHQHSMAHLELWLLLGHVRDLDTTSCTPEAVNTVMHVLASASIKAAQMAEGGCNVQHFEDCFQGARQRLHNLVARRAAAAATATALPDLVADASLSLNPATRKYPLGRLPEAVTAQVQAPGMAAAWRRAEANLGAMPLLPADAPPSHLLQLLQGPSFGDSCEAHLVDQLALRSVENALFASVAAAPAGQMPVLSKDEVQPLADLVDCYRSTLERFLQDRSLQACMHAEQRSRELLVVWVAYCLMEAACCCKHSLLKQYGTSLKFEDLRHLVLSDRQAETAALQVAAYLQARSKPGLAAFSLADGGKATFVLAQEYGEKSSKLLSLWHQEQQDAQARTDEHWEEVTGKQRLANSLRRQLSSLCDRLACEEAECSRAQAAFGRPGTHSLTHPKYARLKQQKAVCSSTRLEITRTERQLSKAEQAPAAVIQPLPEQQDKALQWLFFLYMPPLFRNLSRASFLAQQMLLPPLEELDDVRRAVAWPKSDNFKTTPCDHYNNNQSCDYHTPDTTREGADPAGHVLLRSITPVPDLADIGPKHVDQFFSESDGVYHPDRLALSLAWSGSTVAEACSIQMEQFPLTYFNPFASFNSDHTALWLTESLDEESEALQWAVPLLAGRSAVAADRGNLAIARQDLRPLDRFSKPGFLDFGRLRAYALRQLPVLAAALHERTLALGDAAVGTVVKSALFHLGEVAATSPPSLSWRADWGQARGTLSVLHHELEGLADELEYAPREHGSVLLLGEAAIFLSAWHPPLAATARRFAGMTSRAADAIDERAHAAATDEIEEQTRADQCRQRMRSLLCYGAQALQQSDAAAVVQLIVLINNGNVFLQDADLRKQLYDLRVRCHNLLAVRAEELVRHARNNGSLLTAAAKRVLQRMPNTLVWKQGQLHGDEAACFHAEGSDGHLYSINLLDGTVLLDGSPPSRLPKDIVSHRLYRRTFGDANFQVTIADNGVLQTIKPVKGRFYDFHLRDAGQLVISELDKAQGATLQLADVGADGQCGAWGGQLPVRLRELHSHWLDRVRNVMLLRPLGFHQHDVHFLVQLHPTAVGSLQRLSCWRVPMHLCTQPWTDLLGTCAWAGQRAQGRAALAQLAQQHARLPSAAVQLTDMLVLDTSDIKCRVLAKFEDPQFVHTYLRGSSPASAGAEETLIFELPRYQLEFELRGDTFLSLDYSGYRLAATQQLWSPAPATAGGAGPVHSDGQRDRPSQEQGAPGHYTLLEFRQYLILEQLPGKRLDVGLHKAEQLVLVPRGPVRVSRGQEGRDGGMVRVEVANTSGAKLKVHCYEMHSRFGHLHATSVLARLQLAALYAATSTLLPEPRSQMTGAQTALQLLRHSWVHRPLMQSEGQQLDSVAQLGGYLAPALHALVAEQRLSSHEVHQLRAATNPSKPANPRSPDPEGEADKSRREDASAEVAVNRDELSRYAQQQRQAHYLRQLCGSTDPRMQLSCAEEQRVMGTMPPVPPVPAWMQQGRHQQLDVPPCPVGMTVVADTEAALSKLVKQSAKAQRREPYPLAVREDALRLEEEMHKELRKSWKAHNSTPVATRVSRSSSRVIHDTQVIASDLCPATQLLSYSTLRTRQCFVGVLEQCSWFGLRAGNNRVCKQANVMSQRCIVEAYLLQSIACLPGGTGGSAGAGPCPRRTAFRLLQVAGLVPSPSVLDLAGLAIQPQALHQLNPFLSSQAQEQIAAAVLLWLQLCVLEDRLGRLRLLAEAGKDALPMLVQELETRRNWDVRTHPQWLVFEAEGQLQIRPAQHAVAQHVITQLGNSDHPGPITQLNMGEGKTRVILPMLALHWAKGKQQLVRINLLSTLLDEAHDFLHQNLCASLLHCKLFRLPFHRDVNITHQGARAVRAFLTYCAKVGGMLLVAPEHRLSLQLKWHELHAKGAVDSCHTLEAVAALPYVDILDESDELLHHRYQLVYACGASMALPALQERVDVVRALLHVVSHSAPRDANNATHQRLCAAQVAEWAGPDRPGAFCGLRLLPSRELEREQNILHREWAMTLVQDPPYNLRWMRAKFNNNAKRQLVVECVCNMSRAAKDLLGRSLWDLLTETERSHVLVLRGLLAANVLTHCLQKRHGVTYGISRLASARKRVAVPFRAVETPSERSEYAQPDVALVLTHLSYAYDGLSKAELRAAVQQLLKMGRNAQHSHYKQWLDQGQLATSPHLDQDTITALDDVLKLDPGDPQQLDMLHTAFSHNLAAVSFWLEFCVLQEETKQYPQRLSCSAWHLADNTRGTVAGFSGTNDNHRLLPLQVLQQQVDDNAMQGTNGKMLGIILNNPCYTSLPVTEGVPQWRELLGMVARRSGSGSQSESQLHALIDCGALLEGVSNREAAEHLLPLLDPGCFKGICYYDVARREWTMRERNGRVLPLRSSPIAEREAFVIYDEARCRGADLKLRSQAVALLTLAHGNCKDKLMQAAGRLRKLGCGQELNFVGPPDVTAKVRLASRLGPTVQVTSQHVLQWVMDNTVAATQAGLSEWASQGLHFATTKGRPDMALQDEQLELQDSYGGAMTLEPVATVVKALAGKSLSRSGAGLPAGMQALVSGICQLSAQHGSGYSIVAGAHQADTECERELEKEEEQEQEREEELPPVAALEERNWEYAHALLATSAQQLRRLTDAEPLSNVAKLLQPSSLQMLGWDEKVLCTRNFLHATDHSDLAAGLGTSSNSINEYLRPVDALLLFQDGSVLLVSEREADALTALARSAAGAGASGASATSPVLLSLCYALQAVQNGVPALLAMPLTGRSGEAASRLPSATLLAQIQLFDGGTTYGGQHCAVYKQLRQLLLQQRTCCKEACQKLASSRGKQSQYSHSDLEMASG